MGIVKIIALAIVTLTAGCAGQSLAPPMSLSPSYGGETSSLEQQPPNSLPLGALVSAPLTSRFGTLAAFRTQPLL